MTVVQGDLRGSHYKRGVTRCIICDELLHPPFVEWHDTSLFICVQCCRKTIQDGLVADLVQAAAIADLQDALGPRRRDYTLVRKSMREVEDDARKRIAAERKAWGGADLEQLFYQAFVQPTE